MSNDAPQAGWYPNPDGSGGLRWWSGVGWTEYTRPAESQATQVLGADEATQQLAVDQPTQQLAADQPVPPPAEPSVQPPEAAPPASAPLAGPPTPPGEWNPATPVADPWGRPIAPPPASPVAYGAYAPPAAVPLTGSGMRPLSGLFSDVGRITRRAWWPIIGISVIIWTVMTAVLVAVGLTLVDLPALRRGFDVLGAAMETPEAQFTQAQLDELASNFGQAFSTLPVAGWVALGVLLWLAMLLASAIQIGAVSRLSMDATSAGPVAWGAAWRSGFTGGLRLFGYYLLLVVVASFLYAVITVALVLTWQLSPALAVTLGLLAFLAVIVLSIWVTGRLVPVVAQAVVGRRALRWSWRATRGKFWAVFGRYLLWSLAASVVMNVLTTIVSIPISFVFLGSAATQDPSSSMGWALTLQLLLMPFSMATVAIVIVGIVPIWRDLTDHPVYRSIDENGQPIPAPGK